MSRGAVETRRLQTDDVDLRQCHEVTRREEPDRIVAPGGVMAALLAAPAAGKRRSIGVTGQQDPGVHLRMREVAAAHGFRFDAVQWPLNALDGEFRSCEPHVRPVLGREGIGVWGMQPLRGGARHGHVVTNSVQAPVKPAARWRHVVSRAPARRIAGSMVVSRRASIRESRAG